jgi:hypothetical protein
MTALCIKCHCAECHYAHCPILLNAMPNGIMLSVVLIRHHRYRHLLTFSEEFLKNLDEKEWRGINYRPHIKGPIL